MPDRLDLYIFIDALGWELVDRCRFCADLLPFRYRVTTQLGYSAGAVPTILSGKTPVEHGHFSFFYYDPCHSPFKWMRKLPPWLLPDAFFGRHRVRHHLSKLLKRILGYTGYFQLYRVPFRHLGELNYSEKTDMFVPGGLAPVMNIADAWKGRRSHISNWRNPGEQNFHEMRELIRNGKIDCGFLYCAELDGFLHRHVSEADAVEKELRRYEEKISGLLAVARENYREVNLCVMSDHGMTPLTCTVDIRQALKPYRWGKDYVSFLDSTMARFWWTAPEKRREIMEKISALGHGHWLTDAELEQFNIAFPDRRYGESIYLLDAGAQIVPSDMGKDALPGMHGFSPGDKDSDACFLSTEKPVPPPRWIGDFYKIMTTQGDMK